MIALLVVHIFSIALVSVHYQINKDFIVRELCENRDKPTLNCKGKCHLKKTLKRLGADKTESRPIELSVSEYIGNIALEVKPVVLSVIVMNYPVDTFPQSLAGFTSSVFRPPLV